MEQSEYFLIGEVSRLFHISISTLRYYDRSGLVRPEYTDPDTGYRYYSTRQFERLNTIRYLRALDMPLGEIADFLENRSIGQIQCMLEKQQENVHRKQLELQRIERKIQKRRMQILDALASRLDVIQIVEKPSYRIASIKRKLMPGNYGDLEYFIRLLEESEETTATFLGKVGVGISAEELKSGRYESYDRVFLILDEEDVFRGKTMVLEAGTCAVLRFQGRHEQAPGYYGRLMEYIAEKGYDVSGFSREITMIDNGLTNDTSKYVTEIQIPITKICQAPSQQPAIF